MQTRTLHDLFLHELQQVHLAEKAFLDGLPKLAAKGGKLAVNPATAALSRVQRLEQIFKLLDQVPRAGTCRAMESILADVDLLDVSDTDAQVFANAAAIQTGRSYLLARYTWLAEGANRLGWVPVERLLRVTLDAESGLDKGETSPSTIGNRLTALFDRKV